MKLRPGILAVLATLLVGSGYGGIALAQEGAATLEEVIVTATRREQNLQEIPLAITALSAEALEQRTIENVEDLQLLVPNVDIRGSGRAGAAQGSFTVRGVRGVSRYVDGVALSGDQGSLANVVELERIEVLRGPQGTYFGKNAIGGAVQYVTQKPQDEFGARVKATLGQFNRADLVANVDIPLSDTALSKVTVASLNRGGYVESTTIDESYGEQGNTIFRGMLEWNPSETVSALFTLDYNREDSNMQGYVLFDVVENFYRGPMTPEQYNSQGVPFTDELYAFGKNEEYKSAANYTGPGVDVVSDGFSANVSWEVNDSLTFRSISAIRDVDYGVWFDSDASPLGYFDTWAYQVVDETSQEFQLLGNNERLNWIVGAYYFAEDQTSKAQNWQRIELTGMGAGAPRLRNTLSNVATTDTALYGEFTYDFTDRLTLTLGGRYSEEDLTGTTFVPAEPIGPLQSPSKSLEGDVRIIGGVPVIQNATFSAFTPRVALQYQWSDDVMVYGSVSQGFNGGGVNTTFDPTLPNNGILPYTEEILTNYEFGLRADLDSLLLNVTAFWGDWDDIQIGETLTPGQMTNTNGGAAEISGLEVEGTWRATDNVSLDFTLGLLNTQYTELGQATAIQVGTPFPFAPEQSASIGFQRDSELNNGGSLMVRADYGWISDFETFQEFDFQVALGPNKPYGLLSGRLTYTPPDSNWDLSIFGTNLTNEWYRLGGFAAVLAGIDQGVVARPREIGVAVNLEF